jgi:hypothetical protein
VVVLEVTACVVVAVEVVALLGVVVLPTAVPEVTEEMGLCVSSSDDLAPSLER